jgi:hypothetical protein
MHERTVLKEALKEYIADKESKFTASRSSEGTERFIAVAEEMLDTIIQIPGCTRLGRPGAPVDISFGEYSDFEERVMAVLKRRGIA